MPGIVLGSRNIRQEDKHSYGTHEAQSTDGGMERERENEQVNHADNCTYEQCHLCWKNGDD